MWADQPHADAYLAGGRYLVSAESFIDVSPTATIAVRPRSGPPDGSKVRKAREVSPSRTCAAWHATALPRSRRRWGRRPPG